MRDVLPIGSSPCEEPCAQVGQPEYYQKARQECRRFMQWLRQHLGPEPEGARLAVTSGLCLPMRVGNASDWGGIAMPAKRYRLKLATWMVVREVEDPSPRIFHNPTDTARFAQGLASAQDDD
jgi:hypothetical protein